METRNRIGFARGAGGRGRRALRLVVRAVSGVALATLLAGCEAPVGGANMAIMGPASEPDAQPPGKIPIIVSLAIGEGAGATGGSGKDGIAAVTARIMERLEEAMPAEDFAAVRTFNLFPAIALSADGELIARILAMPEVESIARDHELQLQGPASDLRFK